MKRMNKKGFTLIELLGVIVIIILILSLVLPKIVSRVKSKENDIAMINDSIITNAASLYVDKNKDKYPEVNGNKYCIDMADMDEYLGTAIKDYKDQLVTGKEIQVEYNNAYRFNVVEEGMCVEESPDSSRCETDGLCNVCYVSKTYNNGVYLFEGKILEKSDPSSNVEDLDDSLIVYTDDYGCNEKAVELSTKEYLKDNIDDYPADDGNTYCIALNNPLYSEGRIVSPIINNSGVNIVPGYSSEVSYENGVESIRLVSSNNCHEKRWYDPKLYSKFVPVKYVKSPSNSGKYDNYTEYDSDYSKHGECSEKTTFALGNWVLADPNEKWYDYDDFWWPNAVLLKPGVNKSVGQTIDTSNDIIGMFVWIPKYEYKLGSSYDSMISVNLITKRNQNPTAGYIIPPAFTYGNKEIGGFWVAKFLTTGSFEEPTIIPNNEIMGGTSGSYFKDGFNCALNFSNTYGLDNQIFDSHLLKNSEWAAITYLSDSNYGISNNPYRNGNHVATNCKSLAGKSNGKTSACTVASTSTDLEIDYLNDHRTVVTCQQYGSTYTPTLNQSLGNWSGGSGSYTADSGNNSDAYSATMTISFTVSDKNDAKLSFKYKYTSTLATSSDFTITIKNNSTNSNVSTLTGGASEKSYSKVLAPGSYTITAKFTKDKSLFSSTKRQRSVRITDFSLVAGPWHDVVSTNYVNGIQASTTGTVYGVYDMANFNNQMLSAFINNKDASSLSELGFDSYPERRYYDTIYSETNTSDAKYALCNDELCYGYAMDIETFRWGYTTIGHNVISAGIPVFTRMGIGKKSLYDYDGSLKSAGFAFRIALTEQ